jgi:hypothetical protein
MTTRVTEAVANPLERASALVPEGLALGVAVGAKLLGSAFALYYAYDQDRLFPAEHFPRTWAFVVVVVVVTLLSAAPARYRGAAFVGAFGAGVMLFGGANLAYRGTGLVTALCGAGAWLAMASVNHRQGEVRQAGLVRWALTFPLAVGIAWLSRAVQGSRQGGTVPARRMSPRRAVRGGDEEIVLLIAEVALQDPVEALHGVEQPCQALGRDAVRLNVTNARREARSFRGDLIVGVVEGGQRALEYRLAEPDLIVLFDHLIDDLVHIGSEAAKGREEHILFLGDVDGKVLGEVGIEVPQVLEGRAREGDVTGGGEGSFDRLLGCGHEGIDLGVLTDERGEGLDFCLEVAEGGHAPSVAARQGWRM